MDVEITTIGERGQIVIPQTLRDHLNIEKGEKFMVLERGDMILLKRIRAPSTEDIEIMLKKGHEHAKKYSLTEQDMTEALKKARKK